LKDRPQLPGERAACGLPLVDQLAGLAAPALSDYVAAASQYVLQCRQPGVNTKSGQIRLSDCLADVLKTDLKAILGDEIGEIVSREREVAGGLRLVKADVSEFAEPDGLKLAVELKPVNLAVGRAIWNRFGDIRAFAVNVHLKFPFAVVGGVLALPTWEDDGAGTRKSTRHLIERLVIRLTHAGGRRSEGDASHLLEGVAVIAYDPETGIVDELLPLPGSGLRWSEFVDSLAESYRARFGF
jgi:hypothetical protein